MHARDRSGDHQDRDHEYDVPRARDDYGRPVEPGEPGRSPGRTTLTATLPVRSGRGNLPDEVRAPMEAALGEDFSDVRVHVDGQAADMGALAFTAGDDIHFAPGRYDPSSRGGRELLGHELAHVAQQRQGRASAAHAHFFGAAVNRDPDLEREADELGAKAASFDVRTAAPGRIPPPRHAAPAALRQCKVGFEFETTAWAFEGRKGSSGPFARISNTKKILLFGANKKGGVSADNGHVEFVTVPLTSWAEVEMAYQDFCELVLRFDSGKATRFTSDEDKVAAPHSGCDEHQIKGSATMDVKPQATFGVAAGSIPHLFHELQKMEEKKPKRNDEVGKAEQGIANKETMHGVARAYVDAPAVLKDANSRAVTPFPDAKTQLEVEGFVMILIKELVDAGNRDAAKEDPKYAFPMMPRTDFSSMLGSLEKGAQDHLKKLWAGKDKSPLALAMTAAKLAVDSPVFVKGYLGEDPGKKGAQKWFPGPLVGDWLDSIFSGGGAKDLLSPPQGFPSHASTMQPEGLGAMGTDPDDKKLLVFELRQPAPVEVLTKLKEWLPLMNAFCGMVAEVTGDKKLTPPRK